VTLDGYIRGMSTRATSRSNSLPLALAQAAME